MSRKEVAVIGAGVVGLTTAIKAIESGKYSVTVIAEHLPGDPKSIYYTSPWAGAHHVSGADTDVRQQKMDRETFETMWKLSEEGGEAEGCFMRLSQIEYYADDRVDESLHWMPDFKRLDAADLKFDAKNGFSFTTLTIDTAVYLPYLLQRFLAKGGKVVRAKVQHIAQVIDCAFTSAPPDVLFVCAGLGARWLGGVEDPDVYPIRGQTVLIRAPWIKSGKTVSTPGDDWSYIIPRRSGDVILGGTKSANDWFPKPRSETTREIIERCVALMPEIVPPETRARFADDPNHQYSVADVEPIIIEAGCGLRPARKGGIRLGSEVVDSRTRKAVVVYNYGHGGYGYQSSWGSASMAMEVLETALSS